MSKADELRELSNDELGTKLTEGKRDLFQLRFAIVASQATETARLGQLRREIARIETILRERVESEVGK
ncbi:MAG: 50S ribosomal protein L29 [Ferrimicrobium sp.]